MDKLHLLLDQLLKRKHFENFLSITFRPLFFGNKKIMQAAPSNNTEYSGNSNGHTRIDSA